MFALLLLLLTFSQAFSDKIVKSPQTIRSVNYEDFSLLCADGIPLLMEDHKPRPCQPRPWLKEHKCPTGFWCHEGHSESSFYCCPSSRKFANRCHLPPAVGYGKQRMRRFYFDWKTDACHELQYSGIGGNENCFMDYEKCESACRGAGEPPISLPSNMKILPKVSENKSENKLEKERPAEKDKKVIFPKEATAGISLQPPSTPIGTTQKKIENEVYEAYYTVSPETTSQTPMTMPIQTTSETVADVLDPNPCILAPERGYAGSIAISMWYFDQSSSSCSPFLYLGKGGNSNRFESSEECIETCGIGKPTRKSCELPPAIGNGPFNIPRYYFDRVTKKCERFFYSGRDGNDNRFYKKNKCERLCLKKKTKKKENIFEYTTPSTIGTPMEYTPMRIVQNLVPSQTTTVQTSETNPVNTESYVYTTTKPPMIINPRIQAVTVEPYMEMYTSESKKSQEFQFTTAHPTLIYEPRGETLPTIAPPPTAATSSNIVDHVFSSLMNSQQQSLVDLIQQPHSIVTTESPRFSSRERITFGQVENQPVPMSAYGTGKVTENEYGMKVEPFYGNSGDKTIPQYPASSVYLPAHTSLPTNIVQQPAAPQVLPNSKSISNPNPNQSVPIQQIVQETTKIDVTTQPTQPFIFSNTVPSTSTTAPVAAPVTVSIPVPVVAVESVSFTTSAPFKTLPFEPVSVPNTIQGSGSVSIDRTPVVKVPAQSIIPNNVQPYIPPQVVKSEYVSTTSAPDPLPIQGFISSGSVPGPLPAVVPPSASPLPAPITQSVVASVPISIPGPIPEPSSPAPSFIIPQPYSQLKPKPSNLSYIYPSLPDSTTMFSTTTVFSTTSSTTPPPPPPSSTDPSTTYSPIYSTTVSSPVINVYPPPPVVYPTLQELPAPSVPVPTQAPAPAPAPAQPQNPYPNPDSMSIQMSRFGNLPDNNVQPQISPFLFTTTPIPTLIQPNFTFVTSTTNDSPCRLQLFGDATIMCESRVDICPIGTFCQIGYGQSICCPILEGPPCDQPIDIGVGTSLIRRWSFDPATRLCQPFQFKGFKGNQNNFLTYENCNRACGATNVCPSGNPELSIHTHLLSCSSDVDCPQSYTCIQSTPHNLCCIRYTPIPPIALPPAQISVPTPVPVSFSIPSHSGIGPNLIPESQMPSNLLIDITSQNNLCDQPIDVGYGHYSEHRWAFSNGQCSSFLFRGQGGNMNNFLTRNDCMSKCQAALSSSNNRCSQPAASGNGEQYLSRYFYSPEYRQCLHFIYSGEGGNSNNFESLTECLEICVANGVKFNSLAQTAIPPLATTVQTQPSPPFTFSLLPAKVCPQGDPMVTVNGTPIQCDSSKAAKCPGDHVCTPVGQHSFCCPSPMNYCLQSRPPLQVCTGPNFEPIREIRFTYDPLANKCIRFSFQNCRASTFTPQSSLNNFRTNSQCNRLCCNQGYNLVYKRRLLMAMNDDPVED